VKLIVASIYNDSVRSYSAGFVEGSLTALPLYQMFLNTNPSNGESIRFLHSKETSTNLLCGSLGVNSAVIVFLQQNEAYVMQQIAQNPESNFWFQVKHIHFLL